MFETVPPPPNRLLVFARLPERGRVKRNLTEVLGADTALAIYEAMLRDTIANIGESTPETEIEFLWPPTPHANGSALRRAFAHHAVAMQTGADLGDRLAMAFSERFFFHRTKKIVAVGVDDPSLTRETIDHALGILDSCEYVIGPSESGGYYLFGCRALSFDPIVFREIAWGTSRVLDETRAKIAEINRTVAMLPVRYSLGNAADLSRYAAEHSDGDVARVIRTI